MEGEGRKFQKADTLTMTRQVETLWMGQQPAIYKGVPLRKTNIHHAVQLNNLVHSQDASIDTLVRTLKVAVAAAVDVGAVSGH